MQSCNQIVEAYDILKDPNTIKSRIYVGGTNDKFKEDDFREKFSQYGEILKVGLNRGYTMVQFGTEQAAKNAIENENGSVLCKKTIKVRTAVMKSNSQDQPQKVLDQPGPSKELVDMPFDDWYYSEPLQPHFKTDVEIILDQTPPTDDVFEYAEEIQKELENLKLTVGIIFPNKDYLIRKIINEVQSHGTILVILIKPENVKNQTVTMCFLHPIVYHKNVTIKEAFAKTKLLTDIYIFNKKLDPAQSNAYYEYYKSIQVPQNF